MKRIDHIEQDEDLLDGMKDMKNFLVGMKDNLGGAPQLGLAKIDEQMNMVTGHTAKGKERRVAGWPRGVWSAKDYISGISAQNIVKT